MRRRWLRPRNSTKGSRYQPGLGPPIVQALATSWGLPEPLAIHWWRALCAATWTTATTWREAVLAFHPAHAGATRFVDEACSPTAVVQVVEALVQEGHLARAAATQIEDALLRCVTAAGRWQGQPAPAPAPEVLVEL